jgi:two-component system cell cycle sensor histidine kinase/response regulator CckA
MLRLCTEAIVRHLDAAFARIWTISDDETTLELQASAGLYTHLDGPHSRVPIGTFKIGLIAKERKPHLTNFVLDDPRIGDRDWAKREGLVSFAGYPLLVGSRIVGVVAMFAKKPLGENAMQALSAIADQIALGIDRKWTEQELHLRDRAIGAATQGLIITDHDQPHNPIVYVSPGFVRITGYRPEECYGKNCNFLQGEETDSVAIETIRSSIRDGRPCTVELINYRKDGSQFWNALTLAPVYDGDRVTHYVGVQTDITERRKMEEQFRQVQKMEAIGQLAAGVAHDFNNLLTVINGYSEILLAEKSQNDADRVAISSIRNAGERAASLTAQLLAFSRKAVIEPKVFDLNDVVEHLAKMLRRLIGEDINFTSRLEPGLWKIKADPGQIEQVIMNLSVNARDAMPIGGIITIQTENVNIQPGSDFETRNFEPGRYVRLSVSDTGTGMTEEVKSKIFEPFFTTKGIGKGTGLGLATVFGIVEQAGGHIRVSTTIGKGTTFEVYLAAVADVATNNNQTATATPVNGAETVLIVEDEDAVRMLLRMTLESNGYQVLIAASGPDAIELSDLYHGEIHLLVTDVIMPEMGGRELAENIRSRRKEINVLYVSGYTDDAVVRHGVISSAESFLQKPFTPLVLLRKVRSILDAKRKN